MNKGTSTSVLWKQLFKSNDIKQYITETENTFEFPEFTDYIKKLCEERQETPEQILKRGGIERTYGHRIFRGERNPSRNTVILLAFGFEMSVEDAQTLLKYARMAPLHPKVKRDAVIAHCLEQRESYITAQIILQELGLPLLIKEPK